MTVVAVGYVTCIWFIIMPGLVRRESACMQLVLQVTRKTAELLLCICIMLRYLRLAQLASVMSLVLVAGGRVPFNMKAMTLLVKMQGW